MEQDIALLRRYPGLARRLARVPLTQLPTPVVRLQRLATELGADLWMKRDDVSGPHYGGNKPRKLEFLLGDALRRGKRSVLTTGGIGTHHGLATAVCARQVGLRTILVLLRQPLTEHVRRCLLRDHAAGAELHWAGSVVAVALRALAVCCRDGLRGDLPYIIMTGGTSRLGTIGYLNAAFEFAEQVRAGDVPEPTHVFAPMGSGGTVAGLALGLRMAGLRSRVVAVTVTDILPPSPAKLCRLGNSSWRYLRRLDATIPPARLTRDDFDVVGDFVGTGYGYPSEAGRAALALARDREQLDLDNTYTAKCLAALAAGARAGRYGTGPLLFWNTYSSIDLASVLGELPDYQRLPSPFHPFFEGPTLPA